jgi:hypothetical protein
VNAYAALVTGWMALQWMAATYSLWFLIQDFRTRERDELT